MSISFLLFLKVISGANFFPFSGKEGPYLPEKGKNLPETTRMV